MVEFNKCKIPLTQIRGAFSLFSWSLAIFVQPVALRLLQLLIHFPKITPNSITTIGLFLRLSTVVLFGIGSQYPLLCGALIFYIVAVLDAVDGPLARITGRASEFGRYYDHVTDLVGDFLILLSLGYGQGLFPSPLLISMLFMHIAESYISYVTNIAISARREEIELVEKDVGIIGIFAKYKQFFFRKNLKSFFTYPDYSILTFVVFPLLGSARLGIYFGFVFLTITTLYTILSTFMSLHSSVKKFP